MKEPDAQKALRAIPSVDEILNFKHLARLKSDHPNFPWTRLVRQAVDEVREELLKSGASGDRAEVKAQVIERVLSLFENLSSSGIKRVINGTGVVLHTNLGRAIPGKDVKKAVLEAMSYYVNLEFDLERGERCSRGEQMHRLINLASGAEACMVVNNNAAAVYLVADTFSPPGRVLVSRGELVEIGGSFRLPSILASAAGEVIEVGTTNRTYAEDYAKVARENDVLLKVHRSNYEIEGFAHEASLQELVALAQQKKCYAMFDLGSGALYDFTSAGLSGEEPVYKILATGVDCVTMSGDKLLGGVQAGIIMGKVASLDKLAANPLRRAFRVDKISIAAIEALFRCYLFGNDPVGKVPMLKQALDPVDALRERAKRILEHLQGRAGEHYRLKTADDVAAIGGGSFATQEIPGVALAIACRSGRDAVELARRMRTHTVPIIPRVKGNEVRLNLRSVLPSEDEDLGKHLGVILEGGESP